MLDEPTRQETKTSNLKNYDALFNFCMSVPPKWEVILAHPLARIKIIINVLATLQFKRAWYHNVIMTYFIK